MLPPTNEASKHKKARMCVCGSANAHKYIGSLPLSFLLNGSPISTFKVLEF